MIRPRRRSAALALCGAGAVVAAVAAVATGARADADVDLAAVVAAWPDGYEVTGAKSEPLYTERIQIVRDGDDFGVRIEALGQGDAAFGTQLSAVRVGSDGGVSWIAGCGKAATLCANDTELRGFLATAALVALEREQRLPETATVRSIHGTDVACVDDAELHPDAAPAIVRLDPCFDIGTGAVLAHWSPDSEAFVGATLAPGFTVSTAP